MKLRVTPLSGLLRRICDAPSKHSLASESVTTIWKAESAFLSRLTDNRLYHAERLEHDILEPQSLTFIFRPAARLIQNVAYHSVHQAVLRATQAKELTGVE
jgi:hypothetical protein